ncbi:ATP-dependent RNA helicase HrpA [Nitzschia inconspicua]|uniref:ATP-dependent RNA helicase HrpA n=1 Tax=Nitzschia inconspicua TaxID=303405 RepID=A0A9K3KTD3_9STRA|nr:ATP-dependent RNA helicase HrpA [Nitzschia inconspicua]
MGVKGIKALLRSIGWYPSWENEGFDSADDVGPGNSNTHDYTTSDGASNPKPNPSPLSALSCNCTTRLWKEWNASDAFLGNQNVPPLQRIPPQSLFLIDGNGLAFYLHSIAYSRYLRSFNTDTLSSCCPRIQTLASSESSIVQALPSMMPLSFLRDITQEFVNTLKQHNMQMEVYWDGPLRRHKARTDDERLRYRMQNESNLELFCRYGLMPASKHLRFACQWKDEFPFSKLFLFSIRHALQELDIGMVECTEEADVELALKAHGDPNAYILGFDSDFFFFRNVQYIPLNEISIQPSGLYAFCATRTELARLLRLDDDESTRMVDLALLMGNDYVDPTLHLKLPDESQRQYKSPQEWVFHLQCNDEFEVMAKDDDASKAAVDFVRALYNLENLHCGDFVPQLDGLMAEDDICLTSDVSESNTSSVLLLPEDATIRDGVIRCLKSQLDQVRGDESVSLITLEVLEAYAKATDPVGSVGNESNEVLTATRGKNIRPSWEEMKAGFFIESCIRQLYHSSPNSILTKMTPPSTAIHRLKFHSILAAFRQEKNIAEEPGASRVSQNEATPAVPEPMSLPIDEHESTIIENIQNNRVTVIHGETGCGKSSRVPVMLLKAPAPDGCLRKVKFFISQPRRIAAKALVERVRQCEPELRDKFALRMGHGWKEYESSSTQVYFVTTGYLVRLLANHPERFDDCTHLVIDEVHERSVDTDILCLLCRRLLASNAHIRLVLMSATLATKMYREYFEVSTEPIHVGVRRFPITEFFLEDLKKIRLPSQEMTAIAAIEKEIESKKCRVAPTSAELSKRLQLSARLATIVGQPGASVLIFVPGMAEIITISEYIESYHMVGIKYTCFPIHGDIPFEEQMGAFDEPAEDEVKVIIATNAAESSVTLPNVDHVICLGLCRQIIYNQASHRQMLTPAWISQASAKQRAGRTGRVRPGSVYRLYTEQAYKKYMEEFEPGEMVRIPLDSVILMLKQILHEEVKPVFQECLEPPPLETIDRSFKSLHRWNFITEPDDKADITTLGAFVSSLGIDLSLGSFIGLGIQFGVAAEAIEMAAMMSLPKSPFQMASPTWMTPAVFNETASQTYIAKCDMDDGIYSEPLALMNALWDYSSSSHKNTWCYKNRIAVKRWQQVVSSRNSLRKRVASFLGINEDRLQLQLPPKYMPKEKILILRLLKVWVFSNSIIECPKPSLKFEADGSLVFSLKSKTTTKLTSDMLCQVLDPKRHPFSVNEFHESDQNGVFEEETDFTLGKFMPDFEHRLLSYASEKSFEIVLCHCDDECYLYIDETSEATSKLNKNFDPFAPHISSDHRHAFKYIDKKRRGFQERAAGLWSIQNFPESQGEFSSQKRFQRIHLFRKDCSSFDDIISCTIHELFFSEVKSFMKWEFTRQERSKKSKKSTKSQTFYLSVRGGRAALTKQDMQDLMGRKTTTISTNRQNSSQLLFLQRTKAISSEPRSVTGHVEPLLLDAPESARILALLASSQRRGKSMLKFPVNSGDDPEATVDFVLEEEVNVLKRWRRLGSDKLVYVDESVPATAIQTASPLYAVAANALELQRGGLRVEGLTLLPPTPLFLLLSFLSFGLEVGSSASWIDDFDNDGKESSASKRVNKAYAWLTQCVGQTNGKAASDFLVIGMRLDQDFKEVPIVWKKDEIKNRVNMAVLFHEDAMGMGESLVCFPEKIAQLCDLFDCVDGNSLSPWDTLMDEALTHENLETWRREAKSILSETRQHSTKTCETLGRSPCQGKQPETSGRRAILHQKNENTSDGIAVAPKKEPKLEQHPIRHFKKEVLDKSKDWFSTKLCAGESLPSFPSTNILALLFQLYRELILDDSIVQNGRRPVISLDSSHWDIIRLRKNESGESWYSARFVHNEIPFLPVVGRGKNKLPTWIKKQRGRPSEIEDAQKCVPPHVKSPSIYKIPGGGGLMFETLEEALQMEAAFWLEQQYCHGTKKSLRHWYMHPIDQMVQILRKHKQ